MPNQQQRRPHASVILVMALVVLLVGAIQVQTSEGKGLSARVPVPTTTSTTQATTTTVAPTTTVPPTTLPPTTVPPPPPAPVVPSGKGMWIWQPQYTDDGDVPTIIARAQATGLTHVYVRMGSSVDGAQNGDFLNVFLPAAHAAGIRVIGWDFPYLDDIDTDVARAVEIINYMTPSGDRLDGFSADIETPYEGVALTPESASAYGSMLRAAVGPSYLLIATVPRPSPARLADYPYTEVVTSFDAIAPMVYWIDIPPDGAVIDALSVLAPFGKPILPIGQAYDGSLEGGTPGTPTYDELGAFINAANANGAAGVSFWSWQHASDDMWAAIAAGPEVGIKPPG